MEAEERRAAGHAQHGRCGNREVRLRAAMGGVAAARCGYSDPRGDVFGRRRSGGLQCVLGVGCVAAARCSFLRSRVVPRPRGAAAQICATTGRVPARRLHGGQRWWEFGDGGGAVMRGSGLGCSDAGAAAPNLFFNDDGCGGCVGSTMAGARRHRSSSAFHRPLVASGTPGAGRWFGC